MTGTKGGQRGERSSPKWNQKTKGNRKRTLGAIKKKSKVIVELGWKNESRSPKKKRNSRGKGSAHTKRRKICIADINGKGNGCGRTDHEDNISHSFSESLSQKRIKRKGKCEKGVGGGWLSLSRKGKPSKFR